jgi:ABC-type glycerol-3-phosphate transport system substrate-binding protein
MTEKVIRSPEMKRAVLYWSSIVAFVALIFTAVPLALTVGGQRSTPPEPEPDVITLRYVSTMWREDAIRIQEDQIKEFENAYQHIEVKPTIYVPWTEYRTWLLRAIASDTLPDVVQHGVEFLDEFAGYGVFSSLEKYITEQHYNSIIEPAWETARIEDKIYGLPHMLWLEPVLLYRKDIFRNEGIEPAPVGLPWTMEEAVEAALKLTEDIDGDEEIDRWGWVERGRSGWIFLKHFEWILRSSEGEIIKQLPNGEWKSGMDLAETRSALKSFIDLYTEHRVAPVSAVRYGLEDWMSGFVEGRIAMGTMGSWVGLLLITQNPDTEWGVMDLPYTKTPVTQVATFTMSINSKSNNQDAAWELARWLTTNTVEDRIRISDIQGGVIVLKDILEKAEYQDKPERALYKPFLKSLIQNSNNNMRTWARHPHPQYSDIMIGVVGPAVHNIILGNLSFNEGIKYMDIEINRRLQYSDDL